MPRGKVTGFLMKLSNQRKGLIKIIGATCVTIFSLASLFVGTYAWFSMNTSVTAKGMSVTVSKMSSIDILSSYAIRYDGNYGAIAYDLSGGNKNIAMSEYDYVFTDRNVNTPLFIRMEITNFNTSNDLTVTIPCSHTSYKTGGKVDPYLSNVIGAKFLYGLGTSASLSVDNNTWSGDNVTSFAVTNCYQGMLSHAHEVGGAPGTPFVVSEEKSTSITISLPKGNVFNNDFIISRGGKSIVVVYIVLDYYIYDNVNLIDDYLESYDDGEEHSLSFLSDISTMTLGNEGV